MLFHLSSSLQKVAEREKAALARELHDELGGLLVATKIDVSWLRKRVDDGSDASKLRWERVLRCMDEGLDAQAAHHREPETDAPRQRRPGSGAALAGGREPSPRGHRLRGAVSGDDAGALSRCPDRRLPRGAGMPDEHHEAREGEIGPAHDHGERKGIVRRRTRRRRRNRREPDRDAAIARNPRHPASHRVAGWPTRDPLARARRRHGMPLSHTARTNTGHRRHEQGITLALLSAPAAARRLRPRSRTMRSPDEPRKGFGSHCACNHRAGRGRGSYVATELRSRDRFRRSRSQPGARNTARRSRKASARNASKKRMPHLPKPKRDFRTYAAISSSPTEDKIPIAHSP